MLIEKRDFEGNSNWELNGTSVAHGPSVTRFGQASTFSVLTTKRAAFTFHARAPSSSAAKT